MGNNQGLRTEAGSIRLCRDQDQAGILEVVNAAAEAYRGTIPADRWHDPYMSEAELNAEIAAGVVFSGFENSVGLLGVMGVQSRFNVDLIRHAYVVPAAQGHGVGSALIRDLLSASKKPILVGTWRAAQWAVAFYERHGFAAVSEEDIAPLLRTFWTVPDRQVETSTVLAAPALRPGDAAMLINSFQASGKPNTGSTNL